MGSYPGGVLLLCLLSAWIGGIASAQDPTWSRLPWEERIGIGWYQSQAERGDPEAQYRLGLLLETGIGREADEGAARRSYEAAARQGHGPAQFALARLLHEEEPHLAAAWYRRAAEAGSPGAAFNLGLMLENGQGIPADHEKAIEYYEMAFAGGLPQAALHRGLLEIKRFSPDRVLALAWLLKAKEGGAAQADQAIEVISASMSEAEKTRAEALALGSP